MSLPNWPTAQVPTPPETPEPLPAEGLSPFSARILDQLSLTAWLPAAFVVAHIYLVGAMYLARPENDDQATTKNFTDAVAAINEHALGVTLGVLFGIVLMTLITQSLEFAAIRLLEGYWGGSIVAAIPTLTGVWIQQRTIKLIDHRAGRLERKAFARSTYGIKEALEASPELLDATLLSGLGHRTSHQQANPERKKLLADAERYVLGGEWMEYAPPHLRHRLNSLYLKGRTFPSDGSRLMPTRLGNVLRSFEASLLGDSSGLRMRGYLYERIGKVGPTLVRQHAQYRNRLDMYSVMTLVAALLAIVDGWLLPPILPLPISISAVVALGALSVASYRGAIAAAMDYGPVLLAMDRAARQ